MKELIWNRSHIHYFWLLRIQIWYLLNDDYIIVLIKSVLFAAKRWKFHSIWSGHWSSLDRVFCACDQVVAYVSTAILENSFVTLLYLSQKGNREWIHQNGTQDKVPSVFGQKFGNFRVRLFWNRPQWTDLSLLNNLSICVLNEMRITDGKPGVSENAWVYITSRREWTGRCYPMIFVLLLFSNWKDFSSGP